MNTTKEKRIPDGVRSYVLSLVDEQARELEESCRRYRRWAVVRRCIVLVLLLAVAVLVAEKMAAAAGHPWLTGVGSTEKAMDNIRQILLSL